MNHGGRYSKEPDGTRRRVEGTEDHSDGNRARDAEGVPLDPAAAARERPVKDPATPRAKPDTTEANSE